MNTLYRFGWYALLAAMTGDILVSWLLAFFYKGYSNLGMSISALGNPASPVRLPFNIWMIVEGILFLIAIPAFLKTYLFVSRPVSITAAVFIAVFAVGACILTGFFSVGETREAVTLSSQIHGAGSAAGFMLFLFVPLLVSILSFKRSESLTGIFGIICFVLGIVFFVLFVMSDKPEFAGTVIDNEGLWQRLNLISMYLPLYVIAVRDIGGLH
ncbi:MAG: DUF998 domain-containing protein [Clostridiales bacterium]|nr:DUF998 domain-containing protein [Clostridiales bacterium]